jgi:hypothetical protein
MLICASVPVVDPPMIRSIYINNFNVLRDSIRLSQQPTRQESATIVSLLVPCALRLTAYTLQPLLLVPCTLYLCPVPCTLYLAPCTVIRLNLAKGEVNALN